MLNSTPLNALLLGILFLGEQVLVSGAAHPDAGPPAVESKETTSDAFFAGPIGNIDVEISQQQVAQLRGDTRKYVRATVRFGPQLYTDVGIHLKGGISSFRPLDQRPNLTLNFDRFISRQRFHGLDKIHLNNSVQDPTYMTENICGELFRSAGVPAPRVTNARVRLNGRDLGLYVLIEGVNKSFLKRYFQNAQGNLYEGGLLRDITDELTKISGEKPNDRTDLKLLAQALSSQDLSNRLTRLEMLLDLEQFISFTAIEVIVWDWDGYILQRNNYRLYHDPQRNRFTFIPHGMDQMFQSPFESILPRMNGLVANALVEIPEGRRRYLARVSSILTNIFKTEVITNRINEIEKNILPVLMDYNKTEAIMHSESVSQLKARIVKRRQSIESQLLLSRDLESPGRSQDGTALMKGWEPRNESGNAQLDEKVEDGERRTLWIGTGAEARYVASWRAKNVLKAGRYAFEAQVRTRGVVPISDESGSGAGIRVSGSHKVRINTISGDTSWKMLTYEFDILDRFELVEFVCELRATKGEASFDLLSLRVRRISK